MLRAFKRGLPQKFADFKELLHACMYVFKIELLSYFTAEELISSNKYDPILLLQCEKHNE